MFVRVTLFRRTFRCSLLLPVSLSFPPPGLSRSQPVCSLNRRDLSKDFATTPALDGLFRWGTALRPQPHMLPHQISEI